MTQNSAHISILAPCASRKRVAPGPSACDLCRGLQADVAAAWVTKITHAEPVLPARDLYIGRAFNLTRTMVDRLGARLKILSAGLGLVCGRTVVPSYDLTVTPGGATSIAGRVSDPFDAPAWWAAMGHGPFSASPATFEAGMSVLVPISRAYAALVANTLRQVGPGLRLFGLGAERWLPNDLRPMALPYDARLEGLGRPGTRADFASRALADFCEHILPRSSDLEEQRSLVAARLAAVATPPVALSGRRVDDDTLRAIIRRLEPEIGPRLDKMLHHLRRVEGVACERSRFTRLHVETRAEMGHRAGCDP